MPMSKIQILFERGDRGSEMYMVVDGTVVLSLVSRYIVPCTQKSHCKDICGVFTTEWTSYSYRVFVALAKLRVQSHLWSFFLSYLNEQLVNPLSRPGVLCLRAGLNHLSCKNLWPKHSKHFKILNLKDIMSIMFCQPLLLPPAPPSGIYCLNEARPFEFSK